MFILGEKKSFILWWSSSRMYIWFGTALSILLLGQENIYGTFFIIRMEIKYNILCIDTITITFWFYVIARLILNLFLRNFFMLLLEYLHSFVQVFHPLDKGKKFHEFVNKRTILGIKCTQHIHSRHTQLCSCECACTCVYELLLLLLLGRVCET